MISKVLTLSRLEVAWLLLLLSTLSVDTLSVEDVFEGVLGTAQIVRLLLVVLSFILIAPNLISFLYRPFKGHLFSFRKPLLWYLLFCLIALLSALWSVAILSTVGKISEVIVASLIVLIVSIRNHSYFYLKRLLYITIIFSSILLSIILIGYIFFIEHFSKQSYISGYFEYTIGGEVIPVASNTIARLGGILGIFAIGKYLDNSKVNKKYILLFLYFGIFPLLAEGRTGIAIFILGVSILLITQRPQKAFLFYLPSIVLIVGLYWSDIVLLFKRGQSDELFFTFTGRLLWWEYAYSEFLNKPVFGYGFGVGGRYVFSKINSAFVSGLHNGYMEVLTGVGILGFFPWFISFLLFLLKSFKMILMKVDIYIYGISISYIFSTFLSNGSGGWMSIELGIFIIILGLLSVKGNKNVQTCAK